MRISKKLLSHCTRLYVDWYKYVTQVGKNCHIKNQKDKYICYYLEAEIAVRNVGNKVTYAAQHPRR